MYIFFYFYENKLLILIKAIQDGNFTHLLGTVMLKLWCIPHIPRFHRGKDLHPMEAYQGQVLQFKGKDKNISAHCLCGVIQASRRHSSLSRNGNSNAIFFGLFVCLFLYPL